MTELLYLLWTFFKIGACTFGGGYAMVELVKEQVTANGWMEMQEVLDFIAISESTPGPIAINMATYVGFNVAGLPGAFMATAGVVLPSLIVIMIIARFYKKFIVNSYVAGAMRGLRPAAIALIAAAMISFAAEVFLPVGFSVGNFLTFEMLFSVITLGLCLFLVYKKAKPHYILLLSAMCGLLWGSIQNIFM
ncbi:MAG: chromate transporter [Clostridia bacterium]|nr:chromate transporter [Clostridia bacterium]